jgi:hypothetical protein
MSDSSIALPQTMIAKNYARLFIPAVGLFVTIVFSLLEPDAITVKGMTLDPKIYLNIRAIISMIG